MHEAPFDITKIDEAGIETTDDPFREMLGVRRPQTRDDGRGNRRSPASLPEDLEKLIRQPQDTQVDEVPGVLHDPINPSHYRKHPSGIECIEVTRHMNFNTGNAIKYIWRYLDKGDAIENLKKAQWYLDDEIRRLEGLR